MCRARPPGGTRWCIHWGPGDRLRSEICPTDICSSVLWVKNFTQAEAWGPAGSVRTWAHLDCWPSGRFCDGFMVPPDEQATIIFASFCSFASTAAHGSNISWSSLGRSASRMAWDWGNYSAWTRGSPLCLIISRRTRMRPGGRCPMGSIPWWACRFARWWRPAGDPEEIHTGRWYVNVGKKNLSDPRCWTGYEREKLPSLVRGYLLYISTGLI